jgi:hypothetical protein
MPCIWGRHDRSQVFLGVAVVEDSFVDHLAPASSAVENVSFKVYKGLIDTGAQSTCITRRAAEELKLAPIGKLTIRGVSGTSFHNQYVFKVAFPFRLAAPREEMPRGRLHVVDKSINGIELGAADGEFDVLLGMDIIGLGSLKIDGDGSFSFSF